MIHYGSVHTHFDFDAPGKRSGFLEVAHSNNELAFSSVRVPIGIIHGGKGPTVLLTSGNHGDEYEGQVILHRLMQMLNPEDLKGRLILLPALNAPAVEGRARVSPLDGGNMNRSFSENSGQGPTSAIAAFVSAHLIPMADAILDFHSGGSATQYADCGFLCTGPDQALNAANLELAEAFGASFTMVCPIDGTGGDFDTAAHMQGVRFLACELGGMGTLSRSSMQMGWEGCLRVLARLGLLVADKSSIPPATRFVDMGQGSFHVTTDKQGLAEIGVGLCDKVDAGMQIAQLFDLHNFGQPAQRYNAPQAGVVMVKRRNPVVNPGDHLCLICPEIARPEE